MLLTAHRLKEKRRAASRKEALAALFRAIISILPSDLKLTLQQESASFLGSDSLLLHKPLAYPESSHAHSIVAALADDLESLSDESDGHLGIESDLDLSGTSIVLTKSQINSASLLISWLMSGDPVVLWGPKGSGKATLVEKCVSRIYNMQLITIHCSTNTSARDIMHVLMG